MENSRWTEQGFPITARTFQILICTCGEAGLARRVVERFLKSKKFNYRPFKHSYNATAVSSSSSSFCHIFPALLLCYLKA